MLESFDMAVGHGIASFQTPKRKLRKKRGGELPSVILERRVNQLAARFDRRAPKSRMRPDECCPHAMEGRSLFDDGEAGKYAWLGGLE